MSIHNRDLTNDKVTLEAAFALQKHTVGVKCATITPDKALTAELGLQNNLRSPNSTIRNLIKGVVFREPIVISNIPNYIPNWTSPIIIAKHAYGDT